MHILTLVAMYHLQRTLHNVSRMQQQEPLVDLQLEWLVNEYGDVGFRYRNPAFQSLFYGSTGSIFMY